MARKIERMERDRGRKHFQVSTMSWSYRRRGKDARIQMKREARISVEEGSRRRWMEGMGIDSRRNRVEERSLINRIIMYSAIKISAKAPALNSILNPETSSDSPSAKSKGVRLVSARREINHIKASGREMRSFGTMGWSIDERSKVW